MRSRMLRVCSQASLPTSPVPGWRPVCPATKTRLPNFVAGERFGFGAALPTLTTSFLGIAFSFCVPGLVLEDDGPLALHVGCWIPKYRAASDVGRSRLEPVAAA